MIQIESAHNLPKEKDGLRYLVEREWPAGIHRKVLNVDGWLGELAPSAGLLQWFKNDEEKKAVMKRRFFRELQGKKKIWAPIIAQEQKETKRRITLVYDARHPKFNYASFLRDFLLEQLKKGERIRLPKTKMTRTSSPSTAPSISEQVYRKKRL